MSSNRLLKCAAVLSALVTATLPFAAGAVIISPVAVTATNSFPDSTFGNPLNLINHGGLLTDFTSGVTDFDTYMAGNPQHTIISTGAEWFTNYEISSATLVFDLGANIVVDRVAVWTDEFWGAGSIAVALSLDNVGFTGVGSFNPTDWAPSVASYGADVFGFAATSTRYVRLALSNCPQPNSVAGGGCGLGEVAFDTGTLVTTVPEPSTLALLGLGVLAFAFVRRPAVC